MSVTATVKLELSKLDDLIASCDGNVDAAIEALALQAVAAVQQEIVDKDIIDTGALLNSIHVEPKAEEQVRVVSDGVDYGIYQEFGHLTRPFEKSQGAQNFVAARPFMLPGLLRAVENFAAVVGAWVFGKGAG